MKHQVWKFNLSVQSELKVSMPVGAQIISVQLQNDTPVMWAIVDTQAEKETKIFRVYGTGHNMPSMGLFYIGTWQEKSGFVWHLFEQL